MTKFSRRINIEVFKDEPMTREEFVEFSAVDGAPDDVITEKYERYLHYFQPFWWHAQSPNGKITGNGERYYNEADAWANIDLNFGDDTTVYALPVYGEDRGERLMRFGKTDREHQAGAQ